MTNSNAFYNNLLPTIDELIFNYGTTYKVRTKAGYDSNLLKPIYTNVRNISGICASSSSLNDVVNILGIDANSVKNISSKQLLFSGNSNITKSDEVEYNGKWYSLESIEEIKPANIPLLYILNVK